MSTRKQRRMWTALMIAGGLLVISLISLGVKLTDGMIMQASADEKYPDLYAGTKSGFAAPEKPTVYLTFDDGPSKNTEKILDILKEENIKATFFVTGQYDDNEFAANMFRRMRDEGHTIGLHSYSHRFKEIYKSADNYLGDINKLNEFIIGETGIRPTLIRFAGGSKTSNASANVMRQIAQEVTRRGYIFHDWTVVSGDDGATARAPQDIARKVTQGIKGRQVEILLFHDNPTPTTTPDALKLLIPALREMGYEFDRMIETTPPTQFIKVS